MKKKNRIILLILYIMVLLIMGVGASFAYFTAINKQWYSKKEEVETAVLPMIIYETGHQININANNNNFLKDFGNLIDKTYVKVSLTNGNEMPFVNGFYDIELVLENNNFIYSTEDSSPEILLNVYDNDGKEIKNIDNLEYKNVNGISGFDITTKSGTFNIVKNYEIKTSTNITHQWNFKVTLVNLDESQDKNGKCNLKGYFKIHNSGDDKNV